MIAAEAIYAALSGVGEDIFLEGGLADFFGDVFFFGEGFAGGFIFYEFDSEEETQAADFTDIRVGCERSEGFSKNF